MIGSLPESLEVGGVEYEIRTDFRDILRIMVAMDDPDLDDKEKVFVCLFIIYPALEEIPREHIEEAYRKATQFIDGGAEMKNTAKRTPRIVDWEQDERLLFPAINSVAGKEVRALDYLHWWTFLGYFMEIREGTYSMVLQLRQKRANGKKLEKWEREFWQNNSDICKIRKKLSKEEIETRRRLEALLDGNPV